MTGNNFINGGLTFSGVTFGDRDGCGFDSEEIEQAPPVEVEDADDDE